MCVAIDGGIKRNLSRRFKIKTVSGQDDVSCTKEVIQRRLEHSIDGVDTGFGKLPDLILADGGINQIHAIKEVVSSYNLNIPVFGMVKNDKHQTRALMDENRNELKVSKELLNFITIFQDEVHNTAIEYHRMLREKEMLKSELDDVKGIGEAKRKALLKEFGSIENIKNASIEELTRIKGINESLAQKLKQM